MSSTVFTPPPMHCAPVTLHMMPRIRREPIEVSTYGLQSHKAPLLVNFDGSRDGFTSTIMVCNHNRPSEAKVKAASPNWEEQTIAINNPIRFRPLQALLNWVETAKMPGLEGLNAHKPAESLHKLVLAGNQIAAEITQHDYLSPYQRAELVIYNTQPNKGDAKPKVLQAIPRPMRYDFLTDMTGFLITGRIGDKEALKNYAAGKAAADTFRLKEQLNPWHYMNPIAEKKAKKTQGLETLTLSPAMRKQLSGTAINFGYPGDVDSLGEYSKNLFHMLQKIQHGMQQAEQENPKNTARLGLSYHDENGKKQLKDISYLFPGCSLEEPQQV
jgi:hypothetical protein